MRPSKHSWGARPAMPHPGPRPPDAPAAARPALRLDGTALTCKPNGAIWNRQTKTPAAGSRRFTVCEARTGASGAFFQVCAKRIDRGEFDRALWQFGLDRAVGIKGIRHAV